jgi:hypothetical protein
MFIFFLKEYFCIFLVGKLQQTSRDMVRGGMVPEDTFGVAVDASGKFGHG